MASEPFNYDAIAADYAARVETAPYNAHYERPAMLSLLPDLEGARILDAGCGSGWYASQLLERGATVNAVDSSSAMVEHTRRRLSAEIARGRVTVQVADLAGRLPFDDAVFDGAVSALVLHYMRDWRPAFKEIRRVLRPGGWLQFSTHHPAADAVHFDTRNYFVTEHVVDHWDWVGTVELYRRSLTEIFASIADGGFQVEKVVEPVPTDEFRAVKPDAFIRLMKQPEFIIFVVRAMP
jgi:SAM-dependent methyltransferase